jgi:hypothetical protein
MSELWQAIKDDPSGYWFIATVLTIGLVLCIIGSVWPQGGGRR